MIDDDGAYMTRARWCGEEIYTEAARFREHCLLNDGALLGRAGADARLWTLERLSGLHDLITPIQGGSFIENLRSQLDGRTDEDKQLVAEAMYVLLLFGLDTSSDTRRAHLETLLSDMSQPAQLSTEMEQALKAGGVANFGAGNAWRHAYVRFLIRFATRVKELAADERATTLRDPWRFRDLVADARTGADAMAANSLLHVVFPETFEYMVAEAHRTRLLEAFAAVPGVADASNSDAQIALVRERAQAGQPHAFDLYEPPMVDIWKSDASTAWTEAVALGAKLFAHPRFDPDEREYKLKIAAVLADARQALLAGDPQWTAKLKSGVQHTRNNLSSWRANVAFVEWAKVAESDASALLTQLWSGDAAELEDRLLAFLRDLPREATSGDSTRLSIASLLMLAVDPLWHPFYKYTLDKGFRTALGLTTDAEVAVEAESMTRPEQLAARLGIEGKRVRDFLREEYARDTAEHGREWHLTSEQVARVLEHFAEDDGAHVDGPDPDGTAARYAAWTLLLQELRLRMLAAGHPLRDLLDAQGVAYSLIHGPMPEDWEDHDKAALLAFREGRSVSDNQDVLEDITTQTGGLQLPPITASMADKLLMPTAWLQKVLDLLAEKRQLIFYGPPGTGKTYLADHLGQHFAATGGSYRLVQFHPSYTYEDFFEGYRPDAKSDGTLQFRLVDGVLREIAREARENPATPHVLVVDEINRGNLAKIFGELFFLLEYRDHEVRLQYSKELFSLPPNLYLIGTMNTADKSIALVDAALRRRFYFVGLMPTHPPVNQVLTRWLARHNHDPAPAALLDELNSEIADADFAIGPSYLMTNPKNLERVWEHAILPLLHEHYYGTGQDVDKRFGLSALHARITARANKAVTADGAVEP